MTCQAIQAAKIAEKYVQGHLTEAEKQAFEMHFFDCADCFEELQTLQDMQAELARLQNARAHLPGARRKRRRRNHRAPKYGWLAAGVAVVAAVAGLTVALVQRRLVAPKPAVVPPIAEGSTPGKPAPPPAPALDHAAISLLARIEPPQYIAPTLHGRDDDAARRFRQAMEPYGRQDYRQAILELRVVAPLDKKAPDPHFYLGVCGLVLGQTDDAILELREVIALGETPYLEEAHFFLAKALLAKEDLRGATEELYATIRLAGDRLLEARRILDQVTAIDRR